MFQKASASPFLHPLLVSAVLLAVLLFVTDTQVADYQTAVTVLDWLLGPATVALALPLYRQLRVIGNLGGSVVIPIACGGILAPLLAWIPIYLFSDNLALQSTMLVKSITTPFAIEVGAAINGLPALAAGIVIITGIVGAVSSPLVFRLMKVNDEPSKGIALGTVAHAVGTAHAYQISEEAAALATLALCLNGIVTAILLPLLFAN